MLIRTFRKLEEVVMEIKALSCEDLSNDVLDILLDDIEFDLENLLTKVEFYRYKARK